MSTNIKVLDMTYIAIFTVVMAICSWISIPTLVPFSLQTFGVFLAVAVLGGKRGTLSVVVYLLLAAIGVPVLAEFTGGLGIMLGSTGGYIVGFLLSALIMWAMEYFLGKRTWVLALSMIVGLIVLYLFGTVWFIYIYTRDAEAIGWWTALSWCVFPFVIPDLVKILLALSISKRLAKAIKID